MIAPPMEPADRNIVSIIMGNASASPARETVPSLLTYQASAISVTMVTSIAIMFGAARRRTVGPMGAVRNGDCGAIRVVFLLLIRSVV